MLKNCILAVKNLRERESEREKEKYSVEGLRNREQEMFMAELQD